MGRMEAGCNLQTLAMRHYVSKRGCTQKGVVLIVRTREDQGGRLWLDVADVKASHPEGGGDGRHVTPVTTLDRAVTNPVSKKHCPDHDVTTWS